jgi:uncharacterized membrane protein
MDEAILIVDDSHKQAPVGLSLLRWAGFVLAVFGPGILADSAAMQWAGFAIMILFGFGAVAKYAGKKMTVSEARVLLDKIEANQA